MSAGSAVAERPVVRIICGPTAAGKSAIAMRLAERHGLVIVSADSRQVYRGFDIGTAKPSADDRARVRHEGIDVAAPTERWSAARWADDATRWIEDAGVERVLVVGGTGLYLRALTAPFFTEPPLDAGRRQALMDAVRVWPTERLRGWVRRLDPARAHLGRAQLLRALEVALLSGVRLSALHAGAATAPRFRGRWLVVDPGDRLHAHIEHRLDAMLAAGWADEVRALADTVPSAAPAWQGCGYAALRAAVRTGDVSAARTDILVSTRQYAKRQRTWFRHQLGGQDVTRLDPHAPRAESLAEEWWAAEVGA